jgi:hypothetical protein
VNRHRDVGTRRGDARGMPASVPELARTLRRARTRQGLRLEDVSARTGLPLEQLQALESGTVERIPDRVAILRTLRRYADHLGLPGDRFVLAAVDQWPTTLGHPTTIVAVPPATSSSAGAGPPPAAPTAAQPFDTGVVPLAASTLAARGVPPSGGATTQVARTAAPPAPRPAAGPRGGTGQVPTTSLVDTGVVPAFQPPVPPRGSRGPRTPLGLRILVGVAGLAVLAGVAGLAVDHYEPGWLQDLGITHRPHTPQAQDDAASTSTTSGTTPKTTFAVAATTAGSATLAVRSPTFTVQLTAVGGSSWVQATGAGKSAPTYAGVLTPGTSQTLTATHSMVVLIGSVAAHLAVSIDGKAVGTYVPTAAPFTVTLQSVP